MSTFTWDLEHANSWGIDKDSLSSTTHTSGCLAQVAAAMDEVTALLTTQQQQQQQASSQERCEQQVYCHSLAGELLRWCMSGGSAVLSLPEPVSGSTMRQRAVALAAALTRDLQPGPLDTQNLETVVLLMDR
jgi:hypothetical protein